MELKKYCKGWLARLQINNRQVSTEVRVWTANFGNGTPIYYTQTPTYSLVFHGVTPPSLPLSIFDLDINKIIKKTSGVFSIILVDPNTRTDYFVVDRLGLQAVYYSIINKNEILISSHLMWLLLELGHDGSFDQQGFMDHFGFGYAVDNDHQLYKNIHRIPAGSYLQVTPEQIIVHRYWVEPENVNSVGLKELSDSLFTSITSIPDSPQLFTGLTSGKDSLVLASVIGNKAGISSGTFGCKDSSDQLQGRKLARFLEWKHHSYTLVEEDEFYQWSKFIAMHSAGLTTLSYIDMASFLSQFILPGGVFIIGEGGECVRDFFQVGKFASLNRLYDSYVTPKEILQTVLLPEIYSSDYPDAMIKRARSFYNMSNDQDFAREFYRKTRLPGNFSLRHSVISAICPKISPFLDTNFIDQTYSLPWSWFVDSRLHREIVLYNNPGLIPFFDCPEKGLVTTQEWSQRFPGSIGRTVRSILDENLHNLNNYFSVDKTIQLCQKEIENPSRGVYFLLRLASLCLGLQILNEYRGNPHELSKHTSVLVTV